MVGIRLLESRLGSLTLDVALRGAAELGRIVPGVGPRAHDVRVERDIAYAPGGDRSHRLDVYSPPGPGPHPVLMYVHGGGFRILSKETHWIFGTRFAAAGFVVFNISYRLAPEHPFPVGFHDVLRAYEFVLDQAERFGGDLSRLVVAGESAGANLACALTLACCAPHSDPVASAVYARERVPDAIVPYCGLLQVSDIARFWKQGKPSAVVVARMRSIEKAYLSRAAPGRIRRFADPLLALESELPLARPWPATFASVGGKDPILEDTRRLARALEARGVTVEAPEYPGGIHAFQALVGNAEAEANWEATAAFLRAQGLVGG